MMAHPVEQRRFGIAGTGLIGSSIGLRARLAGADVRGWDIAPEATAEAVARGALDGGVDSFDELLDRADTIVLAAPLDGTLSLIDRIAARPSKASLILDVASLKAPVVRAARSLPHFVPTHPMAGGERSGPSAARPDLFEGAVWAYVSGAGEPAAAAAVAFIAAMGAHPLAVDAFEHDRAVALTSQLPQLLAVALAGQLDGRLNSSLVAALCGPGLRSMTRLAGSSWSMWQSLLRHSDGALAQEVRRMGDVFAELAVELESASSAPLAARFARANHAVDELSAKTLPSEVL